MQSNGDANVTVSLFDILRMSSKFSLFPSFLRADFDAKSIRVRYERLSKGLLRTKYFNSVEENRQGSCPDVVTRFDCNQV